MRLPGPGPLLVATVVLLAVTAGAQPPAAAAGGTPTAAIPVAATVVRQILAMGTLLDVAVTAAEQPTALSASEAAVQAVDAVEARLSTWRDDSELAQLNAAAVGRPFVLSHALLEDLRAARSWWLQTDGTFDPAIGALVAAYDLRGSGRWPTADALAAARQASGLDGLSLPPQASSTTPPPVPGATRRREGLRIDAGGFGKGIALAAAGRAALEAGATTARFDFGGQRFEVGPTGPNTITIADPRDRRRPAVSLVAHGRSVATSANSERRRVVAGRALGHLLDPRSGLPATDFGAVTVVTDDPVAADCLSTALFVMGPERALTWAAGHPDIEVLVLEVHGDGLVARCTNGLRDAATALLPDLKFR